ncbi:MULTISPECIES: hypothetical protein [Actinomadura]|uniref:Uncharacterized protein n=1 Tax=Actinomadura yumaensis TaxID=111807 RepID=A0ABW2CTD0_9ACTN|nr:hypothetical protein [Actinomadura sp. J1-007]MWK37520.1 hypothetical protein [Actinomadura sp. J1-007]
MPALADYRSETRELLARRLASEFAAFTHSAVERCVADVQACATHLGLDATPALVERMAREHLVGMIKSEPPSGRLSARLDDMAPGCAMDGPGDRVDG